MKTLVYASAVLVILLYLLFGAIVVSAQDAVTAVPTAVPTAVQAESAYPIKTVEVLNIGVTDTATEQINTDPYSFLNEQERLFFELLNEHRKNLGCVALIPDINLMKGARYWATKQGYGHASSGYNGECLATTADAKAAFKMWLNSPRHKAIMERSTYRYGGIGFNRSRAVFRTSFEPWLVEPQTTYSTVKSYSKSYSRTYGKNRNRLFSRLFRR
jgi:uncharacterized protein YkwD